MRVINSALLLVGTKLISVVKLFIFFFLFLSVQLVQAQTTSTLAAGVGTQWVNSSGFSTNGGSTIRLGLGVEYLIVAGGGGGGNGWHGGGGGGGGLISGSTALGNTNHSIVVGSGGSGGGYNGGNSTAFGFTAIGGGGGANGGSGSGRAGGSGGGASYISGGTGTSSGGAGTSGQGYNGGNATYQTNVYGSAAGGGGAGGLGVDAYAGSTAGAGGIGFLSEITGTPARYAAGGGGNGANGGTGGGGSAGGQGTDGLGGGGSGPGGPSTGGRGGSGVVIFRYLSQSEVTSGGSLSSISNSLWKVVRFTTNGTLSVSVLEADLISKQTGVISGTGSLTYDSPGTLSLEAANTYTGYTYSKSGTLNLAHINAIQNSTLDLRSTDVGAIGFTLAGSNTYNLGGLAGSRNLNFGANILSIGGNNESTIFSGVLSGGGGIIKTGTGVLSLSANNLYTGNTTISGGVLELNGNLVGTGDVFVESGAKIQGSGSINGVTTIKNNGNIQPGNSIGKITINNKLNLQGGGNYNFQISDPNGSAGTNGWDLIDVNGILEITSTTSSKFNINLWTILNANGNVSGNLTNFNPLNKYTWEIFSADIISGFDASKFSINSSAINGTGGFQSSILATGSFKIEQSGNSLMLVYYPATDQTIDGIDNIVKTTTYTTNTITNRLNLKLGVLVDYLLVAGGGAGGGGKNSNPGGGGGGGGGGMLSGKIELDLINYNLTVGAGGTATGAQGNNGGNSTAFGLTAIGGGGGAGEYSGWPGGSGGSGGGQGGNGGAKGTGTLGQGNDGGGANGGSGGGGGGAGTIGSTASGSTGGAGGAGRSSNITGSSIMYAGGGGGATSSSGTGGVPGTGGGVGGSSSSRNGGAGIANTGGGGGGAAGNSSGSTGTAGRGGSGVIVARYIRDEPLSNIGGAVNSFTENGVVYQVHTFNSSGNFNLSSIIPSAVINSAIIGSGDLSYAGPGILILNADNTYSGTTSVANGTLQIGNGGTTGSISNNSISVAAGATLVFNKSNTYTLGNANVISGSGIVEQASEGTLDLGGITTHAAGTWKLSAGKIINGTLSSGNFSLTEGTITAVLAGSGTLSKTGDGTVTLSGNNTFSGTTSISGGTLVVNGTNSGAGAVTVTTGATLKGSGTIGGATTIQSGGTLHPGNGVGTMTFSDGLTLSGRGNLNWQVNNSIGVAGTNWSSVNVSGVLNIIATSGNKFNINIWSVLASGENGFISNFKPTENTYSWTILTAGSISGFNASAFQINLTPSNGTGGLLSPYKVSGFTIVQDGNSLKLVYSPPTQQTIDGTNNGIESANFTTTTSAGSLTLDLGFFVDYLIVAGGGGGGGDNGGGGGGGGVLAGYNKQLSATSYVVTIGAGGAGGAVNVRGSNGSNSSLFGLTAFGGGGGGGGNSGQTAQAGGSGGGGDGETSFRFGSAGTSIQGFKGGNGSTGGGGGGGGAGGIGSSAIGPNGGNGGAGIANEITGSIAYYGGGGGGGPENLVNHTSTGGIGGGGAGKLGLGNSGTANTGGGGGGAGWNGSQGTGGAGGSGVVIIRYAGSSLGSIGGTITVGSGTATGYTIHTFNASGSFNMSGVSFDARLRATLNGNIIGSGNLVYNGPGLLTLNGSNHTYTGTTNVSSGHLRVNSDIRSSSRLTVTSGATLSGTGTLPATTINGIHNPGSSPGIQTIDGNLTYNTGATLQWELIANDETAADRGVDFDGINMTAGTLTIGTGVNASLIFNGTGSAVDFTDAFWKTDRKWLVFDNVGAPVLLSATNIFDNISVSADKNGTTLISVLPNARFFWTKEGDDIYLNYDSRTPELTVSTEGLAATSTCVGTASAAQTFTVSGQYLLGNITVTAPTGFAISLNGTSYAASQTITPASGSVSATTIYVRLTGAAAGNITGSINVSTTGISAQTVSVTGTVYTLPAITVQPSSASQTICQNGTATALSVTATGDGLTYQWYSNTTNSNTGGTLISGATSNTYTPLTNTVGTVYYYCVVGGECSSSVKTTVSGAIIVLTSVGGTVSGSSSVCTGTNSTTLTLSGHTGSIQWQSSADNVAYTNINGATATTYTATNLTSTTYYRAVVTNGSCSSAMSTVGTITVQSNSVGGSVAGSATVCTGTNSTVLILSGYTGSVVKWQVSTTSNFSSGVTDISHTGSTYTATNLTATRYYRAVVQNGACAPANSAAATVTVSGNAVGGTVTASATSLCAGSNATTLTLSGSTGSIQWQSSSDGTNYTDISGASATTYNATDLPATMYYRARVTNGVCAAVNSNAVTITVNAKPTATISYNSPSFCKTGTAAVSLSGQTGGSFSSTAGLSINSSTGVIDLLQSTPGVYTITYTFSNAAGCASTTTTSITINSAPTSPAVTAGGAPTTICEGTSVALTASAQTSGTISNYQWYKDNTIINGITGNTYAASASGSYTIKAVDINGCVSTQSTAVSVTVNPNPQATITQGSLLTFSNCSGGGSVTLTASSGSGYQWKLNGSNISGATFSTYSTATAGDYSVVITNANGCVSTSAITKVVAAPTVYSSSSTICAGQSTVLNGTGYTLQTGESYRWEYTTVGGSSWSAASGTYTNNTYTATTAGDYRLAIVNTADQTTKSTSCPVSVVVNPVPSIGSISSDATVCAGQQTTLSVSTSTTNPGYQWFNNGVSLDGSTAASYTASTAGSYTVQITDANGCSATSNAVVVSVTSLPDAPSSATGASICGTGNATVSFSSPTSAVYNWYAAATGGTNLNTTASASYTANGISSTTIYYAATLTNGCESATRTAVAATVNPLPTASISYAGTPYCPAGTAAITRTGQAGGIYTSTNGLVINANTGAIDLVNSTPGTYTVTYSFSDGNCSNTTTTSITINPPVAAPTVSASGATEICEGGSVILSSSTGTSYQWYQDGVAITTNGTGSSYTVTQAGSYVVKISSGSCTDVASTAVVVTTKPLPSITTLPNVVICAGASAVLSASGASSYIWSPSTGLSATNIANPTAAPANTTTYTVTGTSANGCSNTATTMVTVNTLPIVAAITGSSSLAVGNTTQLSNNTSGGLWTSSDPNIASVSSTGLVTAVAGGNVLITYQVTNANGCTNASTMNLIISSTPMIVVTGTLNAFSACEGSNSSIQSLVVEGSNLTNDIIITAPTGYKVSADNTTYANSITLPQTNGTVHHTTVYVKLSGIGITSGNYNDVMSVSSTGATTQTVSVSGTVYASPTVSAAGADLLSIPTLSKLLGANTPTSGTGAWSIVSGPNTNASQFSSITSNSSSFTPTVKGSYVLRWTISSGTCTPSTDDVSVKVVDDIWLGTNSSAWNDPANWASGTVPTVGASIDFIVDPSATKNIELNAPLTLGSFDFNGTNVKLVLGSHDATIGTISNPSSTAYVQTIGMGKLNMSVPNGGSILFPIGTSTYSPVTLTNNTGISDAFYASVSDGVFTSGGTSGTVTYASPRVDLTWKIGNTSGNTGSGYVDLLFGWDASKETGTPVNPKLFRHDGTTWLQLSGTPVVNLNINTLSYTGFTGNFSTFSIAENNAALPVTWISFRARRVNHSVMLEWATAAEWNNAFYEIERSNDGFRFTKIGKVKAAVNSRTRNDYSFSDDLPLAGKSFYRLRQVDVDGKFSYSSVVKMEGVVPAIKTWAIPGSGKLNVWVPETIKGKLTLVILDVTGRVYYQEAVGAGVTVVNIDQLKATGVYFIKLLNDGIQIFSSKIMN